MNFVEFHILLVALAHCLDGFFTQTGPLMGGVTTTLSAIQLFIRRRSS